MSNTVPIFRSLSRSSTLAARNCSSDIFLKSAELVQHWKWTGIKRRRELVRVLRSNAERNRNSLWLVSYWENESKWWVRDGQTLHFRQIFALKLWEKRVGTVTSDIRFIPMRPCCTASSEPQAGLLHGNKPKAGLRYVNLTVHRSPLTMAPTNSMHLHHFSLLQWWNDWVLSLPFVFFSKTTSFSTSKLGLLSAQTGPDQFYFMLSWLPLSLYSANSFLLLLPEVCTISDFLDWILF